LVSKEQAYSLFPVSELAADEEAFDWLAVAFGSGVAAEVSGDLVFEQPAAATIDTQIKVANRRPIKCFILVNHTRMEAPSILPVSGTAIVAENDSVSATSSALSPFQKIPS
jgi:hypothetical protein